MLSGKNDKNKSSRKKQNFPALRDENCNREEPVQKPSRIFSWRSGHQPERSFFPRTRFRIPCSVRLTGILRTDTDKTDIVRLSVCPTDVPKYIYQGVPTKGSKKSTSNTFKCEIFLLHTEIMNCDAATRTLVPFSSFKTTLINGASGNDK